MIANRKPAEFHLNQPFPPAGDQPEAIEKLTRGFQSGRDAQVLLGGDRNRKDLYDGQCHFKRRPAGTGAKP